MSAMWQDHGYAPTVYRYADWLMTVPMQVCQFYLLLLAGGDGRLNRHYELEERIAKIKRVCL